MGHDKLYYVYMMTTKTHRVLYTGVTNDLVRRAFQHKERAVEGFTEELREMRLVGGANEIPHFVRNDNG